MCAQNSLFLLSQCNDATNLNREKLCNNPKSGKIRQQFYIRKNYATILNQEKLCNNSKSGNAGNQMCFYRYCGVKVSRADFELYNNGEELLGTRMLELILYPRNSIYKKGDYC